MRAVVGSECVLVDRHVTDGRSALVVAGATEPGVELLLQAADGTVEGFLHRTGVVGDRDRLLTCDAGLEHAALVVDAGLRGVLVAEMDLGVPDAPPGRTIVCYCPMHADVVSHEPGRCPECAMKRLARAEAVGEPRGESGMIFSFEVAPATA